MIDSHVHFWQYEPVKDAWITDEMKVIQRDFLPNDLALVLNQNGMDGCIAIQADQSEAETQFLLDLAAQHSHIKGVVGWVDLSAKQLEERLAYFSQYQKLKGWRHIVQAEPKGFLNDQDFRKGIACLQKYNYTYDLLIYPQQIKEAIGLIAQFPDQAFVIDHGAKPNIKNKELVAWQNDIKLIAQHQNTYCKLSGLLTEADWLNWNEKEIYTYLDVLFDNFGTHRLMFGSDWPVMLLAGKYGEWKNLIALYLNQFSQEEQAAIFSTNAIQFYNL